LKRYRAARGTRPSSAARAFDLPELARTITGATGTPVTYRDLPAGEYASWLQRAGLDEATAHFVAALDASIARGDLETSSQALARPLGHPATPLAEVVAAAHNASPGQTSPAADRSGR
jgi:NAD(P)H dehydrogenase (quinone)